MLTFRTCRKLLFAAAALTLLAGGIDVSSATTLEDYQHRVSAAAALVEQLHGAGEDESNAEPEVFITANLARLREMLPPKETVTLDGAPISVDNTWLHEEIAKYEKNSAGRARAHLLARLAERLRAIDERLQEIKQTPATNADKDADKGRLAEILRRPEYIPAPPQESALERLLVRFLRWLNSLFPNVKPIRPGSSQLIAKIAQILVVGICVAAVALLIWKYGPRFLQGRRKKKSKREARIVLGERLEPDQTASDLLAQADALARGGDLRGAIRKAYIALLCELGDRKLISLAQHKTNRDYLYAVRDKISLYTSMRKLTSAFELHWYGLVPAGENDWTNFRNDYHRVLRLP
jgi:hypothetical protein